MVWFADYEGCVAGPSFHTTLEDALKWCEELIREESRGRTWDWVPIEHNVEYRQFWTRDFDDSLIDIGPGVVMKCDGDSKERCDPNCSADCALNR